MHVLIEMTRAAARDLGGIEDYIAGENLRAAAAQMSRLSTEIEKLADFPELGCAGRVAGSRELVITRTHFIVAYRVRDGVVQVLRVLHGAQSWPDRI